MELTKEQIKYIDNQIERYGVEYWDVRIELVDHTVSYVENNLENQEDFKKVVHEAFVSLGWKGTFSHLNTQGWKKMNTYYRNKQWKRFISFFTNSRNVIVFIITFSFYIYLSQIIELNNFVKVSYCIFMIPAIFFIYESFISWRKKLGKSVNKIYGLNSIIISTLILQIIMMSLNPDAIFPIPAQFYKPFLIVMIPFHLLISLSGYKVYKIEIKKIEKMRKNLLS